MTLASRLATRGNRPVFWLSIEALPEDPRAVGGGAPGWLRVATRIGDSWPSYMIGGLGMPAGFDESVDLTKCSTRLGAMSFTLQERDGFGGSYYWAYWFSYDGGSVQPATKIVSDMTSTSTSVDVDSAAGLAINDVIWLGREAMLITNIVGVTLTVTRAQYGTAASPHRFSVSTDDEYQPHNDGIYTHPPFWRGRRVILYASDLDEDPTVATSYAAVWSGVIDNLTYSTETDTWSVQTRSDLARVDGQLGVSAFRGVVTGPVQSGARLEPMTGVNGQGDVVTVMVRVPAGAPDTPPSGEQGSDLWVESEPGNDTFGLGELGIPGTDDLGRGLLSINDELIEVQATGKSWFQNGPVRTTFYIHRRHRLGSARSALAVGVDAHEVLPTETDTTEFGGLDATRRTWGYWTGGTFTVDAHPATIILNLLVSTGTATATAGGANTSGARNYDTLPRAFGLRIPVAEVDVAGIESWRLRGPIASLGTTAIWFHGEGENIDLKKWMEEHVLQPSGLFLFVAAGQISVGRDESTYELTVANALASDDIVSVANGQATFPGYDLRLDSVFGQVEMMVTRADGSVGRINALNIGLLDRRVASDRALTIKADGFVNEGNTGSALVSRAESIAVRHDRPQPRITLPLAWHLADLELGSRATVTHDFLPDPAGTEVGIDATIGWVVVSLRRDFAGGIVHATLERQGTVKKHIAFAGAITAYAAGAPSITIDDNSYTPSDGNGDPVPDRDSDVVSVDDWVKVVNLRGANVSDQARQVTSITPGAGTDVLGLSGAFTVGGGAYVPAAGDVLVFGIYDANTTAHEKRYAFAADEATRTLGATADAAIEYGG